jgi:hypothetical protein
MKLVLVNFSNVLGLNGFLNFLEGKPLLIYGENIAGKSNIINMLRYCLIPKVRERKGYTEEKRIKKNEILLKKDTTGSVEIFFQQNANLYKLYYFFSRRGKSVGQTQKLFESKQIELPADDDKRIDILKKLEWKDLGVSSAKLLNEKLVEIGVYPEILDVLISPSNVRNFSEAINGSVAKVPEIIKAEISDIHENSGKYMENVKKLNGVIVMEKEELERKIRETKTEFNKFSKSLPEIDASQVFTSGETARNLDNLQVTITKKIESIPSTVGKMNEILSLLSSEKYEIWNGAIDKLVTILLKKEELKTLIRKKEGSKRIDETLNGWNIIFKQLPQDSSPESLSTFVLPDYEKFDFKVLSNPERIKSIFTSLDEAKGLLQKTNKICKKYRVLPETSEINGIIKSYSELLKALKTPLEPKGDPALLSEYKGKVVVSIPLDIALRKIQYLRGIEPTPLVHRPQKIERKKFDKKISDLRTETSAIQSELRKAKENLTKTKTLLKRAKQLRADLEREIEGSKKNAVTIENQLNKLVENVTGAYHHLCEAFKLKHEEINLSSHDTIDASFSIISKKYDEARRIFSQDLTKQLQNYPEISAKYKISEGENFADVVKRLSEEFGKRIQEASKLQEDYKKVNEWILTNKNQINTVENRNKTVIIMNDALLIAQTILALIHEKTDIERIIEELSDKIEENVKDIYNMTFPEDTSFNFEHVSKGQFLSTINNEPITHPSGSQRAAISVGIMLSLAETFGLPIILDEAFDRFCVSTTLTNTSSIPRLKFFCECITNLASTFQACLASYTSFNIEKNPEVLSLINYWKIYLVERSETLEKNIKPLESFLLNE